MARKAAEEAVATKEGLTPAEKQAEVTKVERSTWSDYFSRMQAEAVEATETEARGNRPNLAHGKAPELSKFTEASSADVLSMSGPEVDELDRFEEAQLQHQLDRMGIPRGGARRAGLLHAGRRLLPQTMSELTGAALQASEAWVAEAVAAGRGKVLSDQGPMADVVEARLSKDQSKMRAYRLLRRVVAQMDATRPLHVLTGDAARERAEGPGGLLPFGV